MPVVKREAPTTPPQEFATMRNRLRRFFEEPFGFDLDLPVSWERRMNTLSWSPAVEASENPREYVLTAELPGISPESIEISVVEGVLTLKGSKEEERRSEDKERTYHLWEREYGRFERTFRFPMPVHDAKVTAEFTNGVLTVTVPKVEEPKAAVRTVPIATK